MRKHGFQWNMHAHTPNIGHGQNMWPREKIISIITLSDLYILRVKCICRCKMYIAILGRIYINVIAISNGIHRYEIIIYQ